MSADRWIEIVGWDKFQHYKDKRPVWIKLYCELHSNDAWLKLTGHQRACLIGLWIEYARSGSQLSLDTRSLSRRIGLRVTTQTLDSLNHAGFIRVSSRRRLAQRKRKRKKDLGDSKEPVENTKGPLPDLVRHWLDQNRESGRPSTLSTR